MSEKRKECVIYHIRESASVDASLCLLIESLGSLHPNALRPSHFPGKSVSVTTAWSALRRYWINNNTTRSCSSKPPPARATE